VAPGAAGTGAEVGSTSIIFAAPVGNYFRRIIYQAAR
jgi:hypothetical protein